VKSEIILVDTLEHTVQATTASTSLLKAFHSLSLLVQAECDPNEARRFHLEYMHYFLKVMDFLVLCGCGCIDEFKDDQFIADVVGVIPLCAPYLHEESTSFRIGIQCS
jgi:hypothetical protein